jgi:hypothetical protein
MAQFTEHLTSDSGTVREKYFTISIQTVGNVKSIIFWDMTSCSPLSFNRRFGGTYRLHLQGRRNGFSKPESKRVAGGDMFLRNVG